VNRFVLDNTLTMTWCFADEATEFTETLLNRLGDTGEALVPALWLYEVVNVVGIAVRKGRISEEKARTFLDTLAELPIEIENPVQTHTFTTLRAVANRYQLTA
jgi:predicted nucleic acid-binding protein